MFAAGHSVLEIAAQLYRTRNWVYKWIERSQTGADGWYLNLSTEPHHQPHKLNHATEQAIVHSRQFLERRDTPDTKYAFYGAVGIHQDLDRQGFQDKPSLSTINRVLQRHDLIGTLVKTKHEQKKVYYPQVKARYPGWIHQVDIITPLYIAGYGKVASVNRIDVFTSHAYLQQFDAKNAESMIGFLIGDWQSNGIPRYLQVDNEAAFRGGLYHPKTFGKLVRFCLNFGVEIIFIPFNEPWRNGHVESLNGRFQKLVWDKYRFRDLAHLRRESAIFCQQHNRYQAYRKDHFGQLLICGYTVSRLPHNFTFDTEQTLPITTGRIHFIRQVDENGAVSILNETFTIDKALSYEYIWAVLNTREQSLTFYHKVTKL